MIANLLAASNHYANHDRVEKYRPDTLDDVSGHQDILATIDKFVESNVRSTGLYIMSNR